MVTEKKGRRQKRHVKRETNKQGYKQDRKPAG